MYAVCHPSTLPPVGHGPMRQDPERLLEILDRLAVGRSRHGLLSRLLEVHQVCSAIIVSLGRKRVGVQATRTEPGEKQH